MNHYRGVTEETWKAMALWERYCLVAATMNLTVPWDQIKRVENTIRCHFGAIATQTICEGLTVADAVHLLLEGTRHELPLDVIETICNTIIPRAYDIDIEMGLAGTNLGGFSPKHVETNVSKR